MVSYQVKSRPCSRPGPSNLKVSNNLKDSVVSPLREEKEKKRRRFLIAGYRFGRTLRTRYLKKGSSTEADSQIML